VSVARDLRRTARRASRAVKRKAQRVTRQAQRSGRQVRRELRPLRRELEVWPREAEVVVRNWWRTATHDLRRGDFRTVAVFLLLATFALLPLQNLRVTAGVAIADVVLVVAFLVALASRHPRPPAQPMPWLLRNGIALMVLGGALGLVFADERMASAKLYVRLVAVALLAFVAVVRVAPTGREVRRFLIAFVIVGAGSGIVSAVGDVTGFPLLDRSTFGGRAIGLTVLEYPLVDYLRGTTATSQSLATNPNLFGGVSAIGAALAAVLLVEVRSWRVRAILGAAAFGLTVGVLFSGSRSALLALVIGCVPAVWRLVSRGLGRQVLAGAGLIGLLLVISLFSTVRAPSVDRLLLRSNSADAERSAESTILRYQNATRGLADRGWDSLATGSGLRDDAPSKLHDGHLEIWVGLGLVGMIGWILLCTGVIESGVRYAGRAGPLDARQVALLALGSAFTANVVVTLFVDTIWNRYIWLLVALTVTLLIRPNGVDEPPPSRSARTSVPEPEAEAEAEPEPVPA